MAEAKNFKDMHCSRPTSFLVRLNGPSSGCLYGP